MISYVLIYKKECFLANLEEVRFDTNTIDPKRKKNRFSKNLKVLKSQNWQQCKGSWTSLVLCFPVWHILMLLRFCLNTSCVILLRLNLQKNENKTDT